MAASADLARPDHRTESPARPLTPRELGNGLVLREAQPGDLDQIAALLVARGEPVDALDHQLVVADSAAGWQTCAVVVEGDRVVSTLTLLDEELQLTTGGLAEPVLIPAGQVELVATDATYEGRGLVRALMGWAHDLSCARGHLMQVMIGIPYFYRKFGYSYAIDIAPRRPLAQPLPTTARDGFEVRPATLADLPQVERLQATAQTVADLRMPHPGPRWRWLLEHEASTTWVALRSGDIVATGRMTPPSDGLLLAELAASDPDGALALVASAERMARAESDTAVVMVADRPGTTAGDVVRQVTGPPSPGAQQYYTRIPNAAALLDRIRPVLDARLAASGIQPPETVVLSTFEAHLRMPVVDGRLGPVEPGGTMQSPGRVGGAGVAPDLLAPTLFGPHGIDGMARRHPDVFPGRHGELMAALFPPVTSDLLTYYLP